jgi:transposase
MVIKGEVLLAHGRQPRRRFSAAEKISLVEEASIPGMNISAVARKYAISPSQLFSWRRLMKDGEIKAVESEEEVVPVSEVKVLNVVDPSETGHLHWVSRGESEYS